MGTRGIVWREVGERPRGELPELDEVTSTLKVGSEASPAGREGDSAVRRPRHLQETEKLSPALLSLEPTSLPARSVDTDRLPATGAFGAQQGQGWELLEWQLPHDPKVGPRSHWEVPPDGVGHPMACPLRLWAPQVSATSGRERGQGGGPSLRCQESTSYKSGRS